MELKLRKYGKKETVRPFEIPSSEIICNSKNTNFTVHVVKCRRTDRPTERWIVDLVGLIWAVGRCHSDDKHTHTRSRNRIFGRSVRSLSHVRVNNKETNDRCSRTIHDWPSERLFFFPSHESPIIIDVGGRLDVCVCCPRRKQKSQPELRSVDSTRRHHHHETLSPA